MGASASLRSLFFTALLAGSIACCSAARAEDGSHALRDAAIDAQDAPPTSKPASGWIEDDKGNAFMEEEKPAVPTAPPRKQRVPVDLSNVGVQIDPQGNIVPNIDRSGVPVQGQGSNLEVYQEGYIPPMMPYGGVPTLTPNSISPWGGSSYNYNPYTTVPSWPGYYPNAGAWPYGRQYYPGLMGGGYNLNLGGAGGLNIGINSGMNSRLYNNGAITPFGYPAQNYGWMSPWTQYSSKTTIRPLFSPLP